MTDELDRVVADIEAKRRERPPVLDVMAYKVSRSNAAAAEASWMIRGKWPADAYGVMGAEDKAGKTWAVLDLGVAVVAGVPWLGSLDVDVQGPVTLFLGEGGERGTVRRLDAVAAFHRIDPDLDGLRVCYRVPRLTNAEHLQALTSELQQNPPRLVGLDPLYLAAAGARGSDLYQMGEHLQSIQLACQDIGAALAITTHWNKTGEGAGASRFTGVGPGAWGRVLASAAVEQRHVEAGRSSVLLRWEFTGGEIADSTVRVRRMVWAESDELDSPLHYEVEVTESLEGVDGTVGTGGLPRNQQRVVAALGEWDAPKQTSEVQDAVANDGLGVPLKTTTIRRLLNELADKGLVDGADQGEGTAKRWWRL